ncbi:uncharacterized protein [Gossypium hirsutum]|uniref:Uncharacterized protein isoform X1 n=1 Tax=Gossypium hirsutum TaxID=3635 RepID=A0ABM2ZUG5_GOSHI|nr:uncharacterized protein LOC121215557 isoform X1 [Gossypium hirsutum]
MVGPYSDVGPSASVGSYPHAAGHHFNSSFVGHGSEGHFNAVGQNQPNSNCVQFTGTVGDKSRPGYGSHIPWRTKPRARVFPVTMLAGVGLPRIPNINMSDASNSNGSNVDATNFGDDSYIHMPIGMSSCYPDSGATHHVFRKASALNESTPYSGHQDSGNFTTGHIRDGLYQFSLTACVHPVMASPIADSALLSSSKECNTFTLWHRRLGHPSVPVVKSILDKCQVVLNNSSLTSVCVVCQKGKFHKLSFSPSTIEYNEPFV